MGWEIEEKTGDAKTGEEEVDDEESDVLEFVRVVRFTA